MNSKPCYGCPLRHVEAESRTGSLIRKRCPILQGKLDAVRGLGLKSIDFECSTKTALFTPGQGVAFLGSSDERGEYGERPYETYAGFVMRWRGNKVLVVSEETDSPFCSIFPNRLTPVSDRRRACIHCGMPEGVNIKVKGKFDAEPHAWVCRAEIGEGGDGILPCEYGSATEAEA